MQETQQNDQIRSRSDEEIEIDLLALLKVYWRNALLIILAALIAAGAAQAQAITAYSLAHSLGGLPAPLQEIGRLRMLHPEASLEELGQMLQKPVGKSGANHRMRRLMELIRD